VSICLDLLLLLGFTATAGALSLSMVAIEDRFRRATPPCGAPVVGLVSASKYQCNKLVLSGVFIYNSEHVIMSYE